MDEGKINGRLNGCYTNGLRLLHPSGALKHVVFIALCGACLSICIAFSFQHSSFCFVEKMLT